MRTAVVALIALAAFAMPSMPVAADEGDRRPQDLYLTPVVDGSTIVSWAPPEAGSVLAYHVYRTRGIAAGEDDWFHIGTTGALALTDPDHYVEDDLVQGYRVVAEHADGAYTAQIYGLLRLPPDGAGAASGQNIIRVHASGAHGCFPAFVSGMPPDEVRINAPCTVENVAQFVPQPARGIIVCGFYTVWDLVQPSTDIVGGSGGSTQSQSTGGDGCETT